MYLLYWYFQQNQCLNIKRHTVHNIHILSWGTMLVGSPDNCPVCPYAKTALMRINHTNTNHTSIIDSEGRLRTKFYDKRDYDDFNFSLVNFHSYVASFQQDLHMEYISLQLIRYSIDCGSYQDFRDRWLLLTRKLLNQGFLLVN